MNTWEEAELTASIHHIAKFSKSRIPIYNSEIPDAAHGKATRRRTQVIAKRYVAQPNTITVYNYLLVLKEKVFMKLRKIKNC